MDKFKSEDFAVIMEDESGCIESNTVEANLMLAILEQLEHLNNSLRCVEEAISRRS